MRKGPKGRKRPGVGLPAIVKAAPRVVPFSQLDERERRAFATPGGFCRHYLKMPLTDPQARVIDDLAPNRAAVSCVCCNEAGKTTKKITGVVLWHLTMFRRRGENGGVITTSGSWAQITNQLVPALKSYAHKFPRWDFQSREILVDGIPNWMAFSTRETGRAEGFHGAAEHPLLAIIDEAKSVKDDIFRAIEDRCRPQRTGLFSSPGYALGHFYESQTGAGSHYTRHKLTVEECPWIDRVEMERVIRKAGGGDYEKGLRDPLVRSAYFAEFMKFVEGGLVGFDDIEECLADPPTPRPGDRHAWCDFAAGGDENVFALAVGNRVMLPDCWRDKDTMSSVGRFIQNFEAARRIHGLKPEEIEGDADGMGQPMVKRLQECGWPIIPYYSSSRAFEPKLFHNRQSEVWFGGCEGIKERKWILPDDPELKAQLTDRIGKYGSDGRRWIESKKDLFARQRRDGRPERSPDRADALLGAMARLPRGASFNLVGAPAGPWTTKSDVPVERHEEMSVPEEVLAGFDAGG